jgi:two-component system, OmpR family, response regulator VicR
MDTAKKRVLIVEDDEVLAQVVAHNLVHEHFDVRCVTNGTDALREAKAFVPDVALLDLTLPGSSGLELCRIWSRERRFPIIMMTARDRKDDELAGFGAGADDYITKPFDLERLLARVHAVLRRARPSAGFLTLGRITIDFAGLTAMDGDQPIELSHREFEILRYLAERPNTVVHRNELLRAVWGYHDEPITRSVDKAILRLRKKIERDPHHPAFIHTAHGDGYRLTPST